jgi:hypothetical protein
LTACGGGSSSTDNVLQFTGRDETEANFRGRVREIMLNPAGQAVCNGLRGLSPQEAAAVLRSDEAGDAAQFAGATPKPGQQADSKDLERAADIVLEECDRVS